MPNSSNVAPSDTIQAMYAIASNPTYNVTNLFMLATATPPFTGLSTAPNDYSIAVSYEPMYSALGTLTPAIESAYGIAVDAYGNIWSTSENDSSFYAMTEIGPTGTLLTGPIQSFSVGGTTHSVKTPRYVAIDQSNNAWITNQGDAISGSVAVLPGSTGANAITSTTNSTAVGYATGGTAPYAITIDKNNNVYITNSASAAYNVSEFVNAGGTAAVSAVNTAGATPVGIATDNSSSAGGPFVYVAASGACANAGTVSEFNDSISGASPTFVFGDTTPAYTACTAVTSAIAAPTGEPVGLAVDKNNNLWVVNSVSEGSSGIGATYLVTGGTGTVGSTSASSATFSASSPTYGFAAPWNVAVDGNNNAWFSMTTGGNAIAALAVSTSSGSPVITPLTGSSGLEHTESNSKFNTSRQAIIDGSGNVWVTNNSSSEIPYLTVVVGVAAPVVTPLSVALSNNRVGQKP
jgi:predicted aconitase with swiveling domain